MVTKIEKCFLPGDVWRAVETVLVEMAERATEGKKEREEENREIEEMTTPVPDPFQATICETSWAFYGLFCGLMFALCFAVYWAICGRFCKCRCGWRDSANKRDGKKKQKPKKKWVPFWKRFRFQRVPSDKRKKAEVPMTMKRLLVDVDVEEAKKKHIGKLISVFKWQI